MIALTVLGVACLVIYALSRRHRVDHANVSDSREVMVLASPGRRRLHDHDGAFVVLLSFGIRLVSSADVRVCGGQSGAASQAAGYALIGLAAVLVLLGLYFIVPQFR